MRDRVVKTLMKLVLFKALAGSYSLLPSPHSPFLSLSLCFSVSVSLTSSLHLCLCLCLPLYHCFLFLSVSLTCLLKHTHREHEHAAVLGMSYCRVNISRQHVIPGSEIPSNSGEKHLRDITRFSETIKADTIGLERWLSG